MLSRGETSQIFINRYGGEHSIGSSFIVSSGSIAPRIPNFAHARSSIDQDFFSFDTGSKEFSGRRDEKAITKIEYSIIAKNNLL